MIPGAHPVLSCAEALAFEAKLFSGDEAKEWTAMSCAGQSLASAVLADAQEIGGLPEAGRILVLCGKGHNGGDALIALRALLDARPAARAQVVLPWGFGALRPLVRRTLENLWRAHAPRVKFVGSREGPSGPFDLCLDGLLGMQFRPPLREPVRSLIQKLNGRGDIRLRVAVDLPSGLADERDPEAFRADFTYATGVLKAPLLAEANRDLVGRVRYLDLGFFEPSSPAEVTSTREHVLTGSVLDSLRTSRPSQADKRTFGHLFVVSGSRTMPGAVLMSVEAALISGVGLVTAFVPESLAPAFAARLPEAMWVPMPETLDGGLALEGRGSVVARAARCTGLLAGPGLGRERETQALIAELLKAIDVPAVLDGDALQPDIVAAHYPGGSGVKVLTPHAGEFQRIATEGETLPAAAARTKTTIVLKGPFTRISDGDDTYFAPWGGPVLARGGSGDVLAGLIAGQLATGLAPVEAAARGVAWHGQAADRLARAQGQSSARVTQLMAHLPAVLQDRPAVGIAESRPVSMGPAASSPNVQP